MTNEEVLEKAIKKAIKNGWKYDGVFRNFDNKWILDLPEEQYSTLFTTENYLSIIFSHNFAKALWGLEKSVIDREIMIAGFKPAQLLERDLAWKIHLQQMVLTDDYIEYLGENV